MFGVFIKAVTLIFMFHFGQKGDKVRNHSCAQKGKFYYGVFVGHGPKTSIKNGLKLYPYIVIKTENQDSSN